MLLVLLCKQSISPNNLWNIAHKFHGKNALFISTDKDKAIRSSLYLSLAFSIALFCSLLLPLFLSCWQTDRTSCKQEYLININPKSLPFSFWKLNILFTRAGIYFYCIFPVNNTNTFIMCHLRMSHSHKGLFDLFAALVWCHYSRMYFSSSNYDWKCFTVLFWERLNNTSTAKLFNYAIEN